MAYYGSQFKSGKIMTLTTLLFPFMMTMIVNNIFSFKFYNSLLVGKMVSKFDLHLSKKSIFNKLIELQLFPTLKLDIIIRPAVIETESLQCANLLATSLFSPNLPEEQILELQQFEYDYITTTYNNTQCYQHDSGYPAVLLIAVDKKEFIG